MSTAAVKDGIVYITDLAGILYALDTATGKAFWTHDLESAMWSSPMWVDSKVYMGDENGKITIFAHGKQKKIVNIVDMDEPVYATPVAANGVLFVATKSKIYAISD